MFKKMCTVAIHWCSSNKTLSYMIIDHKYDYLLEPQIIDLETEDLDHAGNKLEEVFKKIKNIIDNSEDKFVIESKTPSPNTQFSRQHAIRNNTHEFGKRIADRINKIVETEDKIEKSLKLKADLKGEDLQKFKDLLFAAVPGNEAYIHRLWAVALHATQKTWKQKINKVLKLKK